MQSLEQTIHIGGRPLTFQIGKVAKQAAGSVLVQAGGTILLVTTQAAKDMRAGTDFIPLTVDYQEKMSAAGRIPGGFFKREGKPRDEETLTSRLIDRSLRPLFCEGWGYETQVIATVFSADPEEAGDTLALTGASLALGISDIPFNGPIAGVRVCRINGQLQLNPQISERKKADLDIFVSVSRDAIVMVEGGGAQISEKEMIDALLFAHAGAQELITLQEKIIKALGKPKRSVPVASKSPELMAKVKDLALRPLEAAYDIREKIPRYQALDNVKKEVVAKLTLEDPSFAEQTGSIDGLLEELKYNLVRERIVKKHERIDGRTATEIRPITGEVGLLPRAHGSALFTRGETQALVTITLGTKQDEQKIDDLHGEHYRNFMLHYNFPPYSVGEVKSLRSPGRREVGHGALAERALSGLVQYGDNFPYTLRVVSDILESNGSSSMATVCGGCLALMDAGVPLKAPCAGIAMGLIKEGDDVVILSDILGDEDHLGDMDFKVAGTKHGITAIQMDIKISGIDRQILEQALEQARVGRLHILNCMEKVLATSRVEVSPYAPRITSFKIKIDRIRDVIGPGGKIIKDIIAKTGCQINIDDDGLVQVSSNDQAASKRAIKIIKDLTQEAEIGKSYLGIVRRITDFGAFVEIFPGTDGLIHISELANHHVKRVEDIVQEGDEVLVKVIGIDKGKVRLSRREAIAEEEALQSSGLGSNVAKNPVESLASPGEGR